jgi:aflatoxin B1 aldehyde reductase
MLNYMCCQVGDTSIDPTAKFDSPAEVEEFLKPFYERGYRQIDTARGYSPHAPLSCEPRLGAANVGDKFIISTKVVSRPDGAHSRDKIAQSIDDSLEALKVSQVDIMYLHQPNRTVPFEETAEAMDKAYREGKFKRFGLSNYTAAEVEQFLKISEERGFVKPTVYQGQYNPVVRTGEKELFPLLHKHNIAFYAWRYAPSQFIRRSCPMTDSIANSPAAAGLFNGNHKNVQAGGRYDTSVSHHVYMGCDLKILTIFSTTWANSMPQSISSQASRLPPTECEKSLPSTTSLATQLH